ncbi:MAG: fibronectin type III domain-containing protein [Ignavibacteria bacterium]|nr:fibronectin type III domain-containing protein [Ignavibacteria bacterium]
MKTPKYHFVLLLICFLVYAAGFSSAQEEPVPNPVSEKNVVTFHDLKPSPKVLKETSRNSRGPVLTDAVNLYSVSRTTGITYTPLTGANTISSWRNTTNIDDNMSNNLPIGFPFVYNGVRSESFRVSTSGFITFNTTSTATGSGTASYGYQNTQFSSSTGTLHTLAPMYEDLQVVALASSIVYKTEGSAGNRVLTVEWISMDYSANTTPDLNFQVKLYESDGHIEFIYGTMTAGTATYTYSCGINAATLSAVPTAAELLTQQTVNSATFSNTASNSLATVPEANSMISFTVPSQSAPNSPTALNFTSVSKIAMTLNWTDNSSDEVGFPVYISTDNVNFSFVGSAAANATSVGITGLLPSTLYYFQVWAANETKFSTSAATGNQSTQAAVPLSGNYTIDPFQPISSTNFQNFLQADTALNLNGVNGPVVITVAGGNYPEVVTLFTINGTSSTNTVKFVGPVSDARVNVNPVGTSATNNYAIALAGADWVTFENIDVTDAGTSIANQVEYGYYVTNNGDADGATNNVIKGANILLGGSGRAPGFSHGILQSTVLTATQSNSNNKYQNVKVDRSDRGIGVFGLTAPAVPTEDNIEISNCVFGQTVSIGDSLSGTSGSPIGIIISNCANAAIFNNTVASVKAFHPTSTALPLGISGQNSTGNIYNNVIKEVSTAHTTSSTPRPSGIQGSGLVSGNLTIYNNFVSGVKRANLTTASTTLSLVALRSTQQGGGGVVRWYHNTVYMDAPVNANYTSAAFGTFAGGVNIEAKNNIFINAIVSNTGARSYGINEANLTNAFYTGTYNNIYVPGGANSYIGLKGTATLCQTLASWRTATGQDMNSNSAAGTFANTSTGDLHLAGGSVGDDANLGAPPLAVVMNDIDGNTRGALKTYKGADEAGTPLTLSTLSLTVNFEAYGLKDTVTVELRKNTAPYDVVESMRGLAGLGTPNSFAFYNAANGTGYYIVVKHRNSIETWSGSTPSFSSGSLAYDFTSSASQAYGSNQVLVGSDYSIYTGDPNQDGTVDGADISLIDNDAFNFVSGYVPTDLNGDDSVDGSDISFADNNAFNFVGVLRP